MIAVINDIDRLLQAAESRYGEAYTLELRLTASEPAFLVHLDATVTPSAIVFIASRVGLGAGPVTFSTDTGVPLTVDGDVATLLPAAMNGPSCTVTVKQTWKGQEYVDRRTVLKTLAFDASTPPAPTGLKASGTLASIQLTWDPTNNSNIGKVEVWRALTNNLAAAAPVAGTAGLARGYSDNIGAEGEFYYWIRYISKANIPGPFNAEQGTHGATGEDADYLLDLLKDRIGESQLLATLRDRIGLIDAAAEVVGSVAQRLALEATARAEAVAAEATARAQALANEAAARESGISSEASAREDGDGFLATRIDTVTSNVASNVAAIASEQTARADADEALGTRIDSVVATVSNNTAAILVEQQARADADSAMSQRIDTIVASAGGANAAVVEERDARVSADAALANRIDSVVATASGNTAAIQAEQTARADADGALSRRIDSIVASSGGANAAVVDERNARVAADDALSSRIDTVVAAVGGNVSAISNEATTRANADSALASSIQTLVTAVGQNTAAIQNEATTRANETGANASATSTLQTTVGNHTSSIQLHQESINGLSSQLFFKIDNNGWGSGFGLSSTPVNGVPTSEFAILADSFKIGFPGYGAVRMFYVDGLGAYMDTAIIRQLEVGKITSGSMNAEWRINGQNGRVVLDTGAVMKVIGTGFGANRDLIEWFGPSMPINQCTKQNATNYEAIDGSAYYGGSLRAGTLYNAQQTTQTAPNAQVPLGPFWSNGRPKVVVVSYNFRSFMQNRNNSSAGYQYNGGATYADIQLLKGGTVVASKRIDGSYSIDNEFDGPDSAEISIGGSFTFTDTGPAGDYTYTAVIVARSTANITHTSGSSTSSSVTQSLGIISTEQ